MVTHRGRILKTISVALHHYSLWLNNDQLTWWLIAEESIFGKQSQLRICFNVPPLKSKMIFYNFTFFLLLPAQTRSEHDNQSHFQHGPPICNTSHSPRPCSIMWTLVPTPISLVRCCSNRGRSPNITAFIKGWIANVPNDYGHVYVLFCNSLAVQDPNWSPGFSRPAWIAVILSYVKRIGFWRCRAMVLNKIRWCHDFWSVTCWTPFHCVRWC